MTPVARLAVCACLTLTPAALVAQGGAVVPRVARVVRAGEVPTIDGRPTESVWQSAPLLGGFVQREPFEGQPATERTEVRFLYDDDFLYAAAWLYDREASAIVEGEVRRDVDVSEMDGIILVLDTFRDRQNAFLFGTSAGGIEYDAQVTREGEGGFSGNTTRQQAGAGGGLNLNWDGKWEVRTSRDSAGWYAEFRIPFATLRYAKAGPQEWGLNIVRFIRRRNEESVWSPLPRQFTHLRISMAGTLQGVSPPVQRPLQVTPYVLSATSRQFTSGAATHSTGEFGGDLKFGVTSSLALDLTYNTDFAQVEVDEQQVNLTRFNLFFPEKRPFFLENAGIFAVGTPQTVDLFFSRRVGISDNGTPVPIVGGGRLTGRAGGMQLGLLNIQTDGVGAIAPVNNSVGRVLKELPNRSRIGLFASHRRDTEGTPDGNTTLAVDGRLGVGTAWTFDGYAAQTTTDGALGTGYAYAASGAYLTRTWEGGLTYREVGEGFNPAMGFMERGANRFVSARVLYHIRTPGVRWFREFRPHITYRENFDLDWFTQTRFLHFDSHFEFANGSFFQLPAFNITREGLRAPFTIAPGVTIPAGSYTNAEWGFAYNSNLSAPVSVQGRIDLGGFYSGRRAGAQGTVNLRRGETFTAQLRYNYYDVTLPEGSFYTSVTGMRLSYAFTPRIYLQSLLQRNSRTGQFSSNVRLGWLGDAGTGLFVVVNDTEQMRPDWSPQDRAVMLKFTRQFELNR